MDYSKHSDILKALEASQEAEQDLREYAREAELFVTTRGGQWEQTVIDAKSDSPRYTFDQVGPIVDQIAGELEQAEFSIRVNPAGGGATKEVAEVYDGLIRNIQNISRFGATLDLSGRQAVTSGISAWCIKQKYVEDDSFFTDLVIDPIASVIDSVWLGPFQRPDASDAKWGVILEAMPKDEYEKRWPEGSGMSVDQNRLSDSYYNKHEHVIVGQVYWIEKRPKVLCLMSNGSVFVKDDIKDVIDELAEAGVTINQERVVEKPYVKTRLFDGKEWLNKAQDTVFCEIPIIPVLPNFQTVENKVVYYGAVEKLMDPQRVYNYSKSREIEEGALAPRAKYAVTPKQVEGFEVDWGRLNVSSDPFIRYNPDPEAPGAPQQQGGASINPGLNQLSTDMKDTMRDVAGFHAANLGDNPNLQSGIAIEKLQNKGDIGSIKYFAAMERAIERTGRILVDAIPKVYDAQRTIRILKEDGSFDMETINQTVMDRQTMRPVKLNDLSVGRYDVVCRSGPAFDSRQQVTVEALTSVAQYDPSVLELAGDVLYKNINAPGMEIVAARKRRQLFTAGLIPFDQMTDEEQREYQQIQQQGQQPDPNMLLAEAERMKAQADSEANQVKLAIAQREQDRKDMETQLKAMNQQFEQQMEMIRQATENLSKEASTLKTLREAMGIDAVVSPGTTMAVQRQSGRVIEAQNNG